MVLQKDQEHDLNQKNIVAEKYDARDYLREFASRHPETWFIPLVEEVISKRAAPDNLFLDAIYEKFLGNNKLNNKKNKLVFQNPSALYNKVEKNTLLVKSFRLKSLTNKKGVNALLEGASIPFHSKLTVIYGKNGSGKSGFVRILKKISNSKTQEDIWQNIHKLKTKNQCEVIISYEKDGDDRTVQWDGNNIIVPLDQLNVFDGKCIPIYLTRSLDFSYQPYGFELFQILSNSLREIHARFLKDIAKKEAEIPSMDNVFNGETVIGKYIASLAADLKLNNLCNLPKWDQRAKRELKTREKERKDLSNIDQRLELLETRLQKLSTLRDKLAEIQLEFSSQNINSYLRLIKNFNILKKQFATKKGKTLNDYKISKMESDEWHSFIEAGEKYINISQPKGYPSMDDGCIFCLQKLTKTSTKIIALYRALFRNKKSTEYESAENELNNAVDDLKNISFSDGFVYKRNDFEKILSPKNIDAAFFALNQADALVKKITTCLYSKKVDKIKTLNLVSTIGSIEKRKIKIKDEIKTTEELKINFDNRVNEIDGAITELLDIREFSKQRKNVEKYIKYKKWVTRANSVAGKLNTKSITDLGSKAWKDLVSDSFKKQFEKEVVGFSAPTVNLEFRGEYGSQMREKNLEGFTKIDDFLSEGEQKAVALSDFFAELSMRDEKAPIIFDDPATSFDQERKGKIARRIVEESELRQIIVFTHDLMFASNIHELVLNTKSNNIDINRAAFHDLSSDGGSIGLLTENYYPGSIKLDSYLSKIENKINKVEKLKGEEKFEGIINTYDMLRKAVEKIVEERIFGGIITRWVDRIQLLSESKATLNRSKLKKAGDLHGEYSRYIESHNQSNEMIQHSLPSMDKLKTDFNDLKKLAQKESDIEKLS